MLGACSSATDPDAQGSEAGDSTAAGSDTGQHDTTTGSDGLADTSGEASSSGGSDAGSESTGTPPAEPFEITVLDHVWLSSVDASQSADGDVDLGAGPFASVRLVMELESPCFPFAKWRDDPPPSGENWPASCDAFDRIANVVADPDGEPFELLRTITPFGGPLATEVDLTDWANARPGAHVLRGFVSTWADAAGQVSGSAGGWFMSARVEVEPGTPPRAVLAAIPLHSGDVTARSGAQSIPFELPEGTTSARIDYLVSGHGGGPVDGDCIGPADEFCRREHTLRFDDVELGSFEPWRDDCVELCTIVPDEWQWDYCAENPCGSIASVQAPRANWCPGSPVAVTPIELAELATPGAHVFEFEIAGIGEGGVWPTSVVAYAYGD
jgi:hypothetical protein